MPIHNWFFSNDHKRILVVDDEQDLVELITEMLHTDHPEFVLATTGDGYEAGLKVASFQPDLIILDIMMPGLNGFEVCRHIKSNPETEHIKILGMTGFAIHHNIEKMLACGADDCLAKPFHIEELRTRIRNLLGLGQSEEHVAHPSR
jgi:DNA-binding response OmpR family regulator